MFGERGKYIIFITSKHLEEQPSKFFMHNLKSSLFK
jgi:hypothetical protein